MNPLSKQYYKFYLRFKYGFHWRKPRYLLRLPINLLKGKLYKLFGIQKFAFRGIDFAVTYACNFNCEHCYAKTLIPKKRTRRMIVDDYKRVAKEAMKLGSAAFSFQGGEVFLHKGWEEVIKAFKPQYNHITITTNGSLLNEEIIKKLWELGVDTVYFSIDSGIAEEHDEFRRHKGSFEKIMKAIELVKKYKMKVAINITVGNFNLYTEGFKKILDFSHKHRIMLETIFARPLGNWDGNVDVMLSEEDIAYYYKLRENYPFVVRDLDNNYGRWGCPTVKEVLYVTPYGDVCPCPYSHVSLGNVLEEPLGVIRERGLKTEWYDHYHEKCLTAREKEFLQVYLPLVGKKKLVKVNELTSE